MSKKQYIARFAYACASVAFFSFHESAQAGKEEETIPDTLVTASRLGDGVTGASTTVISAQEIERSPGTTLSEILARVPGVQVKNLFGGVNGANASVDLRGFGAAATPNTLILVNGRRLNDVDLSAVDLGALPLDGIERIEITRGNAAAVLYGDGAVGGVINIVTKNGFNQPATSSVETAMGSFGYKEAKVSASRAVGPTAFSLNANAINSDGYRDNNELRQRNVMGEVRRAITDGELYLNLSADVQHLGLPGARRVTLTSSELASARKGTSTPGDFADKQGVNAAFGGTRMLAQGVELILDAGVRHKEQQAAFYSTWGNSYSDTSLTTLSLTPRLSAEHGLFGFAGKALVGFDAYQSYYDSDRMVNKGDRPAHRYDLEQRTLSAYAQETLALRADTDLSAGVRFERADLSAKDGYDATAPATGSTKQGLPLDRDDNQHAFHLGFEHRPIESLALFGRLGRSVRLANVDERVGSAAWGVPVNFDLKPQTSRDVEAGLRVKWGPFSLQSSAYYMKLRDELHYSTATNTNVNLDPTRRYGFENGAEYKLFEQLRLKGGLSYTRAQFDAGTWKGNDVPLVSRWTAMGGVSWDAWGKLAVLDVDLRYVGERRFDNDQANFQPMIPSQTLVDLRLGGEAGWARYSLSVQNLFDKDYFDYGIASSATYGTYNAYPMPGRTFMGRLGVTF